MVGLVSQAGRERADMLSKVSVGTHRTDNIPRIGLSKKVFWRSWSLIWILKNKQEGNGRALLAKRATFTLCLGCGVCWSHEAGSLKEIKSSIQKSLGATIRSGLNFSCKGKGSQWLIRRKRVIGSHLHFKWPPLGSLSTRGLVRIESFSLLSPNPNSQGQPGPGLQYAPQTSYHQ